MESQRQAPTPPRRRLVWRYTVVVVVLVAAAMVSVGVSELYFSYQDGKRALSEVAADKASLAADSIEQLIQGILGDLDSLADPKVDRPVLFQRLVEGKRRLSELTYLDGNGRDCAHAYSLEANQINTWVCGGDHSDRPEFTGAKAGHPYFGDVTFDAGTNRPHMTVAVAEHLPGDGVIVADVDLGSLEAIGSAKILAAGYAYAVDARGELITHPDRNLVLKHTSFAYLPQVRAALAASPAELAGVTSTGRDPDDREVLSAWRRVEPPAGGFSSRSRPAWPSRQSSRRSCGPRCCSLCSSSPRW